MEKGNYVPTLLLAFRIAEFFNVVPVYLDIAIRKHQWFPQLLPLQSDNQELLFGLHRQNRLLLFFKLITDCITEYLKKVM